MPRFAANLTLLFTEVPMLDRPDWARRTGFDGVEVLFPYDHPVADWERALAGLPLALINAPPGDWASGDRGFAARPGYETAFRDSFLRAADYATRLGAPRIHVMAGVAKGPQAEGTYAENLSWALAQAPDLGICIEPLNPEDMPGYFLKSADQAAEILKLVGARNVKLQYDLYHQQMSRGAVAEHLRRHFPIIGHIQVAGVPGRNEPDARQELNVAYLFGVIDELGYGGWIGCEYRPRNGTEAGLHWLKPYGIGT